MNEGLPTLRFGAGVDDSVRKALAKDPDFVHPDFAKFQAWVVGDGAPRRVRVVGAIRYGGGDNTIQSFDVLDVLAGTVTRLDRSQVYWSEAEALTARAEFDDDEGMPGPLLW